MPRFAYEGMNVNPYEMLEKHRRSFSLSYDDEIMIRNFMRSNSMLVEQSGEQLAKQLEKEIQKALDNGKGIVAKL